MKTLKKKQKLNSKKNIELADAITSINGEIKDKEHKKIIKKYAEGKISYEEAIEKVKRVAFKRVK